MKKLLSLAMLAAMLLTACVKQENFSDELGDKVNVTFSVTAADVQTKAFGDGSIAGGASTGELLVQAFNQKTDGTFEKTEADITISDPADGVWTVSMKLAKNEIYKIAFWAQKKDNAIYGTDDLSAVTVDYSKIALNSDDADAFCAARYLKVTGALSETVQLYRPLAQINLGTSDREQYNKSVTSDKQAITATLTLPAGIPATLNVIGADSDLEAAPTAAVAASTEAANVITGAAMTDQVITANEVEYDYMAMVYVLADPAKKLMDFSAKFSSATNDNINTVAVSNMPYQANYKTNIVGQLLTGTLDYTVIIEEGFEDAYTKEVAPGFASVAALNEYFETLEDNSDNGNIDPEEVTLSAISDGEVIVLPKVAENLVIRVNGKLSTGSLTIQYAEGATDGQKPENIDLFFAELDNLILNTPDSHVELLAGSSLNSAEVYTSGDTFVIQQGAKVGTLNIAQGNAEIAGEVATVEVVEGATADGGEEPVQVFLASDAAVELITLDAPANVVVEQPKDNIDESDTEYKVAVQVNVNGCSATAQNGGQIYVSVADGVSCTVSADGTSSAETGSVPSGITIAEAGENSSIEAVPTNGGEIEVKEDVEDNVKIYIAEIVDKAKYESLEAAFAAAAEGDEIKVLSDCTVSTSINVTESVTLNLNACAVTNNVTGARMLDLGAEGITLEITGGGKMFIDGEVNQGSYGFVRMSAASQTLNLEGVTLEGVTNNGALLRYNNNNQKIEINNSTLTLTDGEGIDNGGRGAIVYNVGSGNVLSVKNSVVNNYSEALQWSGMFSVPDNKCTFENVTYNSTTCPTGFYVATATFDNCTIAVQSEGTLNINPSYTWLATALATSYGETVTINSGTYTGDQVVYVFSSGGTFIINGGTFVGQASVINVENNTWEPGYAGTSKVVVNGGDFTGPLKVAAWGGAGTAPFSLIEIKGGSFKAEAGKLFSSAAPGVISITGGYFSEDPSAYIEDNCVVISGNEDYPYKVVQVTDGTLIKYDSSKTAAQNGTIMFNTIMNGENGTKYYLTEGTWEVDNNTSRLINKAFSLEGLGEVTILGTSNRYAMVLDDDANNGYVVNLTNLTLKTSNSTTGALHPLYVKNWITVNLYNVTIDTDYFAAICLDSSNKVKVGGESVFVDDVDTKVNMYGCTIVEGKKVLLNANPTSAYLTTTDRITLAHFNFDSACEGVSEETCEAQFYSTGSNLFVNGEALPQLLPEGYSLVDGRVVKDE